MYMRRSFFLLFCLVCSAVSWANDVTFRVNAASSVVAGEQFRVEYIVNDDGRDFRVGEFVGLEVLMGPSQSSSMSTQVVNGKVTSETAKTFTFILLAENPGEYSIPSASVKVDGRQYMTDAKPIKVLPQGERAQSQGETASNGLGKNDLMVRLALSKTKVYEGEAITATVKLMTLNNQVQIQNAAMPTFDGFTVQEVKLPEQKSFDLEHYNNKNYYAVELAQYILFPQRTGEFKIKPATLDLAVQVRTQQRMRSIFDDFFEGYQQVNKRVVSASPTIEVMPLPAGKPVGFSGGVGDFTIQTSLSKQEVKANEALTYRIEIAGKGNIKYIKDPAVEFHSDFEVYDPKVDVVVNATAAGVTGKKTIEYTIIPRHAGDFQIDPIQFSFFDLKTKSYKTLSTPAYAIQVQRGEASDQGASSSVSNYNTIQKEDLKVLANDIRYLLPVKEALLSKTNTPFWGTLSYWMIYVVSLLLSVLLLVVYRKRIKEQANVAFVRNKKANKVATKRLKSAAIYLKSHQKEPFYEEMLKAIWGYLADKLGIETSELTRENVEQSLAQKQVPAALISHFMDLLSACEFARYAPAQDDQAMDDLYESTVKAIGDLENSIGN